MKVKDLIQELSKLPQEEEIDFRSYDNHYDAEVKYKEGYTNAPYIYLTRR